MNIPGLAAYTSKPLQAMLYDEGIHPAHSLQPWQDEAARACCNFSRRDQEVPVFQ